ncbi:MAG: hypothetical protein PUG67_01500 [Peptoniphilaceae bacterium]|nr:hypothetical protein [Peptoniphilaceae bacterium]MDY6018438.1 hypothetical protein [Anaerococcus sp.]
MKFIKKIITLFCCLTISMTLITPNYAYANDQNFNQLQEAFVDMLNTAENSEDITNTTSLTHYKDLSKNLIRNKNIKLNAKKYILDFENIKAIRTNYKKNTYTSVYIPIKKGAYSLLSALVVMYNSNDDLINYSETLITERSNKFRITTYIGGKLIETKQTNIDYVNDSEIQKGLEEFRVLANKQKCSISNYSSKKKSSKKKIAACITSIAGINGGVAYLIAGTCIASCPAIVPICVACIAGVCSLGVADVKGIVSCFKL